MPACLSEPPGNAPPCARLEAKALRKSIQLLCEDRKDTPRPALVMQLLVSLVPLHDAQIITKAALPDKEVKPNGRVFYSRHISLPFLRHVKDACNYFFHSPLSSCQEGAGVRGMGGRFSPPHGKKRGSENTNTHTLSAMAEPLTH